MEEDKKIEVPECLTEEDLEGYDLVYERPHTLTEKRFHYCPGCGHSTVHKLLGEVIEELGIQDKTIGVAPVGCSVFAYDYLDIDMQEAAHGRATAVATGIKRVLPDRYVFTYQGDGDLAAIGTAETIHTVNRGEHILIIFINNGVYGMTSGQMAPTTLPGMKTTTSPYGRDVGNVGYPLKMCELLANLPGAYYVTRQAVHTPNHVRKCKKALINGFKYQDLKKGTSFVEIVTNCPSNWKMTPLETLKFLEEEMLKYYPLGDVKLPPKE
ncbi:MAG: thiamine pyrophosphate-dependent enzyme [Ignavibacteria bacterium]|nr:thiamine pyrophosphate-dependent enzyme [Ignavibacteria bacterium]